jgi:hypothetical protein
VAGDQHGCEQHSVTRKDFVAHKEKAMDSRELFERYLQAVRKYLPWQRQDDIVAELRANLEAQRDEREAELGRPLTEGEMIDWLKELGPPMQMAERYQPPRYLIGPGIFPMYWHILRLVALWASVGYAVSIVARIIAEPHTPGWVAGQIAQFPNILLISAGWVTAIFVGLEYISSRYPEKCPDFLATAPRWSPTSLPPLEKVQPAGGKPRSLPVAVAELMAHFAVLVWLLLIPAHPFLLLGPGADVLKHAAVRLMPVCFVAFWAVLAFNAIQLAWQAANLLTGNWRVQSKVQHLVIKALGIVPLAILVAAPGQQYIALNAAEAGRLPAGFSFEAINHGIFGAVVVVTSIVAIQFAWDMWNARPGARPMQLLRFML